MLQQEIKLLNEQIEHERQENTNPKLQKLIAENRQLALEKQELEKELGPDDHPSALQKLLLGQRTQFEDLNEYLKTMAGLEAVESKEASIQFLKSQQAQARETYEKQKEAINDLQCEYDAVLKQSIKGEEANQRLTREYGKAKVEIRNLNDQIKSLEASSQSRIKEIEQFALDIEEQNQKIQALELQLKSQNSELEEKSLAIRELEKQLNEGRDSIAALQSELTDKDTLLKDAQQSASSQSQLIDQMKNTLDMKIQGFDEKEGLVQLKEREIADLGQRLEALQQKLDHSLKEKDDQLQISQNLLVQVDHENSQKNILKKELASVNQKLKERESEREEQVQAKEKLESLVSELNAQLLENREVFEQR